MKLYNSQSQQIETFTPTQQPVTLYVCGITPYDTTHLGHAFTYTIADILVRHLEAGGHQVRYVQNVTDIDDDILRRAAEVGVNWRALGNRWTTHFIHDMQALNVRPPDVYPRATTMIPQIIALVERLLAADVAYESAGNVYFSVAAWPEYGNLCHLPPAELLAIANERGNRPDDPHKRAPLDFVLWQAQVPGEPAWASPWGPGRPGWHIECSAMATQFLGDTIDIHSGGSDLCFPHHASERAQVEVLTGRSFVRLWLHTAMVEHEGAKMSKSLGNLVMVRDLLTHYSADALRFYLASHHYRRPWTYSQYSLTRAAEQVHTVLRAVQIPGGEKARFDAAPYCRYIGAALDDDLNTPNALTTLLHLADEILSAASAGAVVSEAQATLRALSSIFGLRLGFDIEPAIHNGWARHLADFADGGLATANALATLQIPDRYSSTWSVRDPLMTSLDPTSYPSVVSTHLSPVAP
jgi:L-cysteine:1D-myo-inositol 2-amino-2-deoxy-alpha-D-glucopyranoside ligase